MPEHDDAENEYDPLLDDASTVSDSDPIEKVNSQEVETKEEDTNNSHEEEVPYKNPVLNKGKKPNRNPTLIVPNGKINITELEEILIKFKKLNTVENKTTESYKEELSELMAALHTLAAIGYDDNEFNRVFVRKLSDFVQYVVGDKGKKIKINHLNFSVDSDTEELDGKDAVRYLSRLTGVGSVTKVPLWHSGLILTVDSFRERRLLDLNISLARQRVSLGNNTRGASYSGDDVYVTTTIIDFILAHVIDSNLKGWTMDKLRSLIKTPDIPALLTGALSAIYPSGYPILHSCNDRGELNCTYNVTAEKKENGDYREDGLLDFTKVLWTDRSRLSTVARAHMSSGNNVHKISDIKNYQSNLFKGEFNSGKRLWGSNDKAIDVYFKVPNLTDYSKICKEWIERVIEMVDSAIALETGINKEEREEKRNAMMVSYSLTLDLLKQSNWIDYFKVTDGEESRVINNQKSINDNLEVFSEIEDFSETFNTAIQEYKEDITISLAGLPNYKCPSCGKGQTDPDSKYPTLIPINMIGYFFLIMEWGVMTRS